MKKRIVMLLCTAILALGLTAAPAMASAGPLSPIEEETYGRCLRYNVPGSLLYHSGMLNVIRFMMFGEKKVNRSIEAPVLSNGG